MVNMQNSLSHTMKTSRNRPVSATTMKMNGFKLFVVETEGEEREQTSNE